MSGFLFICFSLGYGGGMFVDGGFVNENESGRFSSSFGYIGIGCDVSGTAAVVVQSHRGM
ncbi:hypothetical protein [Rhizobium sp. ZW T2_16]|uniref:hypothetical protein n=1 Tax=Rhizobium sp. ZW T2_16 TaxID=3378083 RepID=UPI003851CEEA